MSRNHECTPTCKLLMKNGKAGLEQTRMKFALADPINYQDLWDQKCNTALHELMHSDLKLRTPFGNLKRIKQDLFCYLYIFYMI